MGRCLVKLLDGDREWFLEWSSVVDAPVTYGMSRDELRAHIKAEQGAEGLRALPERLARCDAKGTSSFDDPSAEAVIRGNRAGADETMLSMEQIIDTYCRKRPADGEPEPERPRGKRR